MNIIKMLCFPENCAELSFATSTQSILVTYLELWATHALVWDNDFPTVQCNFRMYTHYPLSDVRQSCAFTILSPRLAVFYKHF